MRKMEQVINEAMTEEALSALLDAVCVTDADLKRAWRLLKTATSGATTEQHTALETLFSILARSARKNAGRG